MTRPIDTFGAAFRLITPMLIGALSWFVVTGIQDIKKTIEDGRSEVKSLVQKQNDLEKDFIYIKATCCPRNYGQISLCQTCEKTN